MKEYNYIKANMATARHQGRTLAGAFTFTFTLIYLDLVEFNLDF